VSHWVADLGHLAVSALLFLCLTRQGVGFTQQADGPVNVLEAIKQAQYRIGRPRTWSISHPIWQFGEQPLQPSGIDCTLRVRVSV
jgi:hypothetical protein